MYGGPPHPYEDLLPFVEKPARYVGGETGSRPSGRPDDLFVALCYADVYEIGMSHKGLLNLCAALGRVPGVAVERCFAPWPDLAALLRRRGVPLATLESGRPLREAALVGISFASPLNFTTALLMLELGGIPLRAVDRRDGDPLVLGGGQAMFNAEPMAAFLDAVALGEGEELIVEVAATLRAARDRRRPRAELIAALGRLDGIYIPARYEPRYDADGRGVAPVPDAPARITKRVVAAPSAGTAAAPLVANIPPVHDRLAVEVARGCVWGCRFCQAGMVTRPPRERDAATCLAEARALVAATGAEELSWLALNACDYSALDGLAAASRAALPAVKFTLPSARVQTYAAETAATLAGHKRRQQTFAPEVGTDRLRRVLNKPFTNDDVLSTVAAAGRAGCRTVKLYFMVGVPTETDDDARAIGELAARCRLALREGRGSWGDIHVAVSPFVPQAHTPFQWRGMTAPDVLRRRLEMARRAMPRPVKVEAEVGARVLEGALARGDRRLGAVVEDAYRRGAVFDAWRARYRRDAWEAAFAAAGLDLTAYAGRDLPLDGPLPWDHVATGVAPAFLRAEAERAGRGEITAPCGGLSCRRCGACDDVSSRLNATILTAPSRGGEDDESRVVRRLRFTYAKEGRYRWLSHLELWRLVAAQLARAGVPVARSSGFSPRPRLILTPALAVGVAGRAECGDARLHDAMSPAAFTARVNAAGPFHVTRVHEVPVSSPAPDVLITGARYEALLSPLAAAAGTDRATWAAAVTARLRAAEGEGTPGCVVLAWDAATLALAFELPARGGGKPFDAVARAAGVTPADARAAVITRLEVLGLT